MKNFWYVWLHRTDHLALGFALVFLAVIGSVTGAIWPAFAALFALAWDLDRTHRRMVMLRHLAATDSPIDTSPFPRTGQTRE